MRSFWAGGILILHASISPALHAEETRALVVVNDNSLDSQLIGNEYAIQRNIPDSHIVHVLSPNSYFVSTEDYFSLRDQILRFGICPLVAEEKRPSACNDMGQPIYTEANIKLLTDNAPVSYIVLTRGVPTRFTPPDGSNESATVDAYLHYGLTRYFDDKSDVALNFNDRAIAYGIEHNFGGKFYPAASNIANRLRPSDPKIDREYIIGRLDNVDRASAMRLAGKTISAESNGIYGKVYTSLGLWEAPYSVDSDMSRGPGFGYRHNGENKRYGDSYTLAMFGESRPECADLKTNYLSVAEDSFSAAVPPAGEAPGYCRVKFTRGRHESQDLAPGMAGSRQPLVDNALVYFGFLDGQSPQGGFEQLKNWRKNDTCSNTVCATAASPESCRSSSRDAAKVLDTSCVGVSAGAIGFNFRSYSASLMGLWPKGWQPHNPENAVEIPSLAKSNGSLVFDGSDEPDIPQCWRYGSDKLLRLDNDCSSGRRMNALQYVLLGPSTAANYQVSVKVMTQGLRTPGKVQLGLEWHTDKVGSECPEGWLPYGDEECFIWDTKLTDLGSSGQWQTVTSSFQTPSNASIKNNLVKLVISAPDSTFYPSNGVNPIQARTIAVTDVSMVAAGTHENLVTNGSFNDKNQYADVTGDFNYAANFLGRLGGTAFWGSAGHHLSQGHSFGRQESRILHEFLHGLPLGDAVWLFGASNTGIFYGDPLYNPTRLRMIPSGMQSGRFYNAFKMTGTAYNGEISTVSTQMAICDSHDILSCDARSAWKNLPASSGGDGYIQTALAATVDSYFPRYGAYAVRLSAQFTHPTTGETITLNDYFNAFRGYTDEEIPRFNVEGIVTTPSGAAIPGAKILLTHSSGSLSASGISDMRGSYIIEKALPAGEYIVTATSTGNTLRLKSGDTKIVITDRSVTNADWVASPSSIGISGRVTWTQGTTALPVAGIRVIARQGTSILATRRTSANGSYAFNGLVPGTYTIGIDGSKSIYVGDSNIYGTGWSATPTTLALSNQSATLNITLQPLGGNWLTGQLKHPDGTLAQEEVIEVTNCVDGKIHYVVTDSSGRFRLNGLSGTGAAALDSCPAGKARLTAFDSISGDKKFTLPPILVSLNTDLALAQQSEPVAAQCNTANPATGSAGCSIIGYVTHATTGATLGNVAIKLTRSADGMTRTVTTDASGRYMFNELAGGTYIIQAGSGTSVTVTLTNWNRIDANLKI